MMNNRSASRLSTWSLWAVIIVVVCLVLRKFTSHTYHDGVGTALRQWITENNLPFLTTTLKENGITSIEELLAIDVSRFVRSNKLTRKQKKIFTQKIYKLKVKTEELVEWLQNYGLKKYAKGFYKQGYIDIEVIKQKMTPLEINELISSMDGTLTDYKLLIEAVEELKEKSYGWIIVQVIYFIFQSFMFLIKWSFRVFLFIFVFVILKNVTLPHYRTIRTRQPQRMTLFRSLFGNFLDPMSCKVYWLWQDNAPVGCTATFILKLFKKNPFLSYQITGTENLLIEVRNKDGKEEIMKEKVGNNAFQVTFHPKRSGTYKISILLNGKNIAGSPFTKKFLPGPVDLSNITILNGITTIVATKGIYYPLKVETRDKYNNLCDIENQELFQVHVEKVDNITKVIDPELVIFPDTEGGQNMLHIKIEEEGCFHSTVTYQGRSITNGSFDIISLKKTDTELLSKATLKNSWHQTWYEAFLLPPDDPSQHVDGLASDQNSFLKKCQKIYVYFSSRQVTIKEFYLKIVPYRLYSFRISPSTKILFPDQKDPLLSYPPFVMDDGMQPPVTFMSPKRNLIVATFARLLLRNIGGAESFNDKKRFFYNALQSHHGREKSGQEKKTEVAVNRQNILESSYEATKNFTVSKWSRKFFVKFDGEEGYDAGGVSREWISVLCSALFNTKNMLFTQFNKGDKQALIYPNPDRPAKLKLKYYEFAGRIVGKCIYESSCSTSRRLNVRARFMRSFLAQLIGLRVNYMYFKTDDKQLYSSKIKYIQDVNPEDLGLTFSEEEYDRNGQLIKEVELVPNGSKIAVTQQNKMQYLDSLAQYRLHTRVSAEIEAFTKGLNELVPDNLLTMFSEQELELLICGTSDISVNDLKQNHNLFAEDALFCKVMDWFWKTIALFNQEEIARLLQFTTGSSQLPPGGFADLRPTFSFMSSPLRDVLPRAHTCFNQLVLPDYSSYEEFQRCLHLAITEGCEGFGFE